ncbi:GGDEF domain-containing protein [Helicobacter burdigaliensis]|uniref:GGDEF domain-containing protein n=1 Tax=Helicobacter burdigaliensis TaxID=2315334 RepID=UPI000EF751FD|nr:diguanylate cyclase [Helicobacter burdigaliensis]
MLSSKIAREALKDLIKEGRDPTPEAYADAYYKVSLRLGVCVSEECFYDTKKLFSLLDKDIQESLQGKNYKTQNELTLSLIQMVNHQQFYYKAFLTQKEIMRYCLRLLSTHSNKSIKTLAQEQLLEWDKLNQSLALKWKENWGDLIRKLNKGENNKNEELEDNEEKFLEVFLQMEGNAEFKEWQKDFEKLLKEKETKKEELKNQLLKLERFFTLKKQEQDLIQAKSANEEIQDYRFKELQSLPIDLSTSLINKEGMESVLCFAENAYCQNGVHYCVISFGIANCEKLLEIYKEEATRRVVATLGRLLKQYSNDKDLIAYYGKCEFLACLLNRDKEEAIAFIRQLDEAVKKSIFMFQESRIPISLCAQVSFREDEKSLETMLEKSQNLLQAHKKEAGIF